MTVNSVPERSHSVSVYSSHNVHLGTYVVDAVAIVSIVPPLISILCHLPVSTANCFAVGQHSRLFDDTGSIAFHRARCPDARPRRPGSQCKPLPHSFRCSTLFNSQNHHHHHPRVHLQVTVVGVYAVPDEPIANYNYIRVPLNAEDAQLLTKKPVLMPAHGDDGIAAAFRQMRSLFDLLRAIHTLSMNALTSRTVQQVRRDGHFDLVVIGYVMNDYLVGLAAHFGCPAVLISSTHSTLGMRNLVGTPSIVAHVPNPMWPRQAGEQRMTFAQRLRNFCMQCIESIVTAGAERFVYEPVYVQHFGVSGSNYAAAKRRISLVLVNSHLSLGAAAPQMPAMIDVGGLHVKLQPDALPAALATWLDDRSDGVILVSFGTMVRTDELGAEQVEILVRAFAALPPQQRVLWKWDGSVAPPNVSANVMLARWLPQDDVLAHRNVRLFVSHCGLGSINEAKYHGVPILAVPLFGDQPANAEAIVQEGWALKLDIRKLTVEALCRALHEMLTNGSYRAEVGRRSQLYRDRPAHPLETAIWWVEYVLRHNGAIHMQSEAVNLNWFQYNSYDVLAVLLLLGGAMTWLGKVCVAFAWRRLRGCCRKSVPKSNKKRKSE